MIRRRLFTGALSNYAGKFTSVAVWFFLTPFMLHQLGPEGYAVWVLVGSIASYGYLLDFGIGGAVVKYVATHTARGEKIKVNRLISTALWLYLALGLIAFAGSLALAPVLPVLFNIPESEHHTTFWVVILMGATVGSTIMFAPVITALQGFHRYDLYNLVNAAGSLVTAVATVVVLLSGGGLIGVVAVSLPVTLLMRLAALRLVSRIAPWLQFTWRGGSRSLARQILGFSLSTFMMQISGRLNSKTDEFVIAAFQPLALVAPYAIARKLGELAQLMAEQLLKAILPLAAELEAKRDPERLKKLYVVGTRLTLAVLAPVGVVLLLLPDAVLTAWVGAAYATHASLVVVLTLASLIGTTQLSAGFILQGVAQHHFVARATLLAGVANLILSIVLVGPLGLHGVALGTLIPTTLLSFGVLLPFAMRTLHVRPWEAIRDIWLPGSLPALPAAAAVYLLHQAFPAPSLVVVGLFTIAAGLIYAAGYMSTAAATLERQLLVELVERVWGSTTGRPPRPPTKGSTHHAKEERPLVESSS